jgi:hypothetical protein
MTNHIWLKYGLLFLLAGCANQPTGSQIVAQGTNALEKVEVHQSLAQAPVHPLPIKAIKVSIDSKDTAFNFGTKKAFFKLFRLPPFKAPYSITILSQQEGQYTNSALFMPTFITLDGQFKVMREYNETKMVNRGNGVELTVFINPSNSNEEYILIHGGALKGKIVQSMPLVQTSVIVTPYGSFAYSSGAEVESIIHNSPIGSIEIEQRGLPEQ